MYEVLEYAPLQKILKRLTLCLCSYPLWHAEVPTIEEHQLQLHPVMQE